MVKGEGIKPADLKITDEKLQKEWNPWIIKLGRGYAIVDTSVVPEMGDQPPRRFLDFYRKVWDGKLKETSFPAPYQPGP